MDEPRFRTVANYLAGIFSAGNDSSRALAAADWYVRAHEAEDEIHAFVNAITGFEALFHHSRDQDSKEGVTSRIADRLAYLTGHTHSQRDVIAAEFKKDYGIRSRLLHAGGVELSPDDRQRLSSILRQLAAAILADVRRMAQARSTPGVVDAVQ